MILGSGDIGLIMARRMTLEGAEVQVVVRTDAIFRRIESEILYSVWMILEFR